MKKIFISQEILDSLFAEGKADLEGDKLTIHSRQDQEYKLVPAFKFLFVADGTEDQHGMVGKIYAKDELEKTGCDIYMDSAIVHDVPYQVEPGFIGEPGTREGEKEAQKLAEEGKAESVDESKLLADYLMKIL